MNLGCFRVKSATRECCPEEFREWGSAHDRRARDHHAVGGCFAPARLPTAKVNMMKAIVQDAYGTEPEAVLRLVEIAQPTIGDDEVLVRVRAASVDRGTWHVMTGRPYLVRAVGFGLRASPRPRGPAAIRHLIEGHARGKVAIAV